ncbi:hypothetical protein N7495_010013 [Penicillium taxi]|uniref:uncharacterized protein n=1 Tax=Penicillium taxi TaxID=168475 RepID=UPI002545B34D|nr:uncharacterized protein N7495_010013 [Penicillium taxi]KAJ5885503.1 hypothetical protein N7495_010013 [Penicillium taxi]
MRRWISTSRSNRKGINPGCYQCSISCGSAHESAEDRLVAALGRVWDMRAGQASTSESLQPRVQQMQSQPSYPYKIDAQRDTRGITRHRNSQWGPDPNGAICWTCGKGGHTSREYGNKPLPL